MRLIAELGPPSGRIGHRCQDSGLHRLLVRAAVSAGDGECHRLAGGGEVVHRHVCPHRGHQCGVVLGVIVPPSVYGAGVPRRGSAVVGEGICLRLPAVGGLDPNRLKPEGEEVPHVGLIEYDPSDQTSGQIIDLDGFQPLVHLGVHVEQHVAGTEVDPPDVRVVLRHVLPGRHREGVARWVHDRSKVRLDKAAFGAVVQVDLAVEALVRGHVDKRDGAGGMSGVIVKDCQGVREPGAEHLRHV